MTEAVADKVADQHETAGLKQFVDADRLSKDVSINLADLDTAMIEQASLAVHYGTNTVQARRQYDRLKTSMEILEAKLDATYREVLAADGKKVTETMIANAIKLDKSWGAAQAKLIDAHSFWKMAEVAENSMYQRRDLLLEVARDRRKEREGQLRVTEMQGARDQVLQALANKN